MNHDEQRLVALRMTREAGAARTEASLKDERECFEEILKTAVDEVGLDALIPYVLRGEPEWAYHALRCLPNIGAHRDALLRRVAETPASAALTLHTIPDVGSHRDALADKAGTLAQPLGKISGFSLMNQGGFVCRFTMFWLDDGRTQPQTGTPDPGHWVYSGNILLGQSESKDCAAFSLPHSPLKAGDTVWIDVAVQAGKPNESKVHFTYDPTVPTTACFTISGTTTINRLGFNGFC